MRETLRPACAKQRKKIEYRTINTGTATAARHIKKGGFIMALKTNSKKARTNIQNYIMDNFCGDNYGYETPATFKECARLILDTFESEYIHKYNATRNRQELFCEWCAGLPSILDTCYFYNRSAVDDLGAILDETDAEKNRFSESDAEQLLSRLIYREIVTAK